MAGKHGDQQDEEWKMVSGPDRSAIGASATWPSAKPPPGSFEEIGTGGVDAENDEDDIGRPAGMAGALDFGLAADMSSWKTASFGSFRPPGMAGMGMGMDGPPGAFMPPGMMPGMGYDMSQVGGQPMGMPPIFGGSAAELEAQAAELDLRAAQLKHAALQAEMAAQQARSVSNTQASQASPMMGPSTSDLANGTSSDAMMQNYANMMAGYGAGNPAMIPNPQWMPPPMMGGMGNPWGVQMPSSNAKASTKAKPKKVAAAPAKATTSASSTATGDYTTLMLRNIPNNYNREMVLELLDSEGFSGMYDFVYLPMDFHRMAGLGYAFVNVVDHETALRLKAHFEGFASWKLASQKVCEVSWGEPLQGLEAHIERYRNSPVMHEDVPDKYKPVLYEKGARVDFPPPTKRIRPPRVKKSCAGGAKGDAAAAGGAIDE